MKLISGLFIFLVLLLTWTFPLYAKSPVAGWNFDITKVYAQGAHVFVEVCSRSNHGLNGPVMVICNVDGHDFTLNQVHFNSGDCHTVQFRIPNGLISPEWDAARKIAGSRPPQYPHRKNVAVSVKGGGLFGIGYGLWQFDYWSGHLELTPE